MRVQHATCPRTVPLPLLGGDPIAAAIEAHRATRDESEHPPPRDPDARAAAYRARIVSMGRKGKGAVAAQAGRLIIEHGDDALRWLLREREPSDLRRRLAACLVEAGLQGLEQVEVFR